MQWAAPRGSDAERSIAAGMGVQEKAPGSVDLQLGQTREGW